MLIPQNLTHDPVQSKISDTLRSNLHTGHLLEKREEEDENVPSSLEYDVRGGKEHFLNFLALKNG